MLDSAPFWIWIRGNVPICTVELLSYRNWFSDRDVEHILPLTLRNPERIAPALSQKKRRTWCGIKHQFQKRQKKARYRLLRNRCTLSEELKAPFEDRTGPADHWHCLKKPEGMLWNWSNFAGRNKTYSFSDFVCNISWHLCYSRILDLVWHCQIALLFASRIRYRPFIFTFEFLSFYSMII